MKCPWTIYGYPRFRRAECQYPEQTPIPFNGVLYSRVLFTDQRQRGRSVADQTRSPSMDLVSEIGNRTIAIVYRATDRSLFLAMCCPCQRRLGSVRQVRIPLLKRKAYREQYQAVVFRGIYVAGQQYFASNTTAYFQIWLYVCMQSSAVLRPGSLSRQVAGSSTLYGVHNWNCRGRLMPIGFNSAIVSPAERSGSACGRQH